MVSMNGMQVVLSGDICQTTMQKLQFARFKLLRSFYAMIPALVCFDVGIRLNREVCFAISPIFVSQDNQL